MELREGDFVTDAVRLVRPLAQGGMGRVWIAEHLGLHCQVVVKLMAQEMAAREDGAARFTREAAIAAAIKSPHVVQVFDHGVTRAGVPYIVMELLEGKDLSVVLEERGRLEPAEAAEVVVQVGKALAKAHKAGIVHRDIKPENIFICAADDGASDDMDDMDGPGLHVKLLDFGTAKQTGGMHKATVPGEIMGTPYYMSPEQAIGATVDARTDMWSLGVVAFEMLSGVKPFEGPNVGAIALAIHAGMPVLSTRVSDLPLALDAWFERACAKLPHERFATMREMTAAFVEALTGVVSSNDTTEAIVLPRRISIRPSSPPSSGAGVGAGAGARGSAGVGVRASAGVSAGVSAGASASGSADEMRKTLQTSIEPSIPPPAHPHPAFAETASFGSALGAGGRAGEGAGGLASPGVGGLASSGASGLASDSAVEVPIEARPERGGRSTVERGEPGAALESIAPLAATLTADRPGQRSTKIAAGIVALAAAGLMAAILVHNPSTPTAQPASAAAGMPTVGMPTPPSPPAAGMPTPLPPTAAGMPTESEAAKPEAAKPEAAKSEVAKPEALSTDSQPAVHRKSTKKGSSAATPASSSKPSGKKGSKAEDEDLANLIKAGTEPTPAPAPTPLPPKSDVPTPAPAPTPLPPKEPAPAPTPIPKAEPAPTPTPLPPVPARP